MRWLDTIKGWFSSKNDIYPCTDCIVLPVGCIEICDKVETDDRKLSEIMIKKGCCPDCGGKDFLEGPRGGGSQNIQCDKCKHEFNVMGGPMGIHRI